MPTLDPGLLGRANALSQVFKGYRHQALGRNPTSGIGALRNGGRFNPPNSFPVVYLCTTRACAIAEFYRLATREDEAVEEFLPRELWEIRATLRSALDLTDSRCRNLLSVSKAALVGDDYSITQEIGVAANNVGLDAILSPSATGVDKVLAILRNNIDEADLGTDLLATWCTIDDLT